MITLFVQASALIKEICGNLSAAAKTVSNTEYTVVLRGDSTLRGHFPEVWGTNRRNKYKFPTFISQELHALSFECVGSRCSHISNW